MENTMEDKFKHPHCFSLPPAHRLVVLPVVNLQSPLLATRYVYWLKVDHTFPFGFSWREVRKVITALPPAVFPAGCRFRWTLLLRIWNIIKKPCKVTESFSLKLWWSRRLHMVSRPVSCRWGPLPLMMVLEDVLANMIIFVLPSAWGTTDVLCWQAA